MYKKVSTDMNFVKREEQVLEFWRKHDIRHKVTALNSQGENFTQYDGPPTANGKPHIGHFLTRAIKDIIPRYKRMQGYHVEFKAGWDTHGLPVELEVEKLLHINGKPQIEAYGLEPFIKKCKESVWKYKDEWEQMSERVAYCADMDNPYVTYDNTYIESEWWALKKIWEKGLLYEGHKIVPYCPRCGTALASHEVAQGYKDVKETSVFIRFKVEGEANTWFAAWTTTPWTLPSNVALCVNPEADYALVEVMVDDKDQSADSDECSCGVLKIDAAQAGRYWVAVALVEKLFGHKAKVIKTCKGKELEHVTYEPLFPYGRKAIEAAQKKAYYVTCGDYVTLSDGTGIVHIAPAFGEDDAQIGRAYDLPFLQLVKEDGTMHEDVSDFAGMFCKDADKPIIKMMAMNKSLLAAIQFEHSYPFCWRCDTPLIYYARHSWFIRMSQMREAMVANNNQVNWIPESIREGRFGNFIANAIDWGLSRERYWGTPLPVWRCEHCGKLHVVGSIEELRRLAPACPEDIELHKPYIDAVKFPCPDCNHVMKRVSEVIDCWFDSGAMPFAQYHYPFENKELFEANFPAQFISEAQDQTRGWFYSLMAISTLLFDRTPYENVIVMGLVQDKDGIKMSKHKGNVISPQEAIDRMGSDAVRWYFYTNSNPWLPSRFSFDSVAEGQRRFMGTLWNTYAFYILYADIDQFDPAKYKLEYNKLSVMDRWIISRLQSAIKTVRDYLDHYDITAAARSLQEFVDELSNWYVRRCRTRYWADGMEADKRDAYLTLYTVLRSVVEMAAPFVPFIAEEIYQNLVRSVDATAPESVHLAKYPVADLNEIDSQLEAEMAEVLQIVALGRAARNEANVKNRQPLAKMTVVSPRRLPETMLAVIADELNVRKLVYADNAADLVDHKFKPQLRTLGKRFGKQLPLLTKALQTMDTCVAWQRLQETGSISVDLAGEPVSLTADDLLIETAQKNDLATQQDRDITVALDLSLTPELIAAGLVRELISKIQTSRKEAGFEVADRIAIYYQADPELVDIFNKYADVVKDETLAISIENCNDATDFAAKEWNINGLKCCIKVVRRA